MKFNNVLILVLACALAFQQGHAGQDHAIWVFRDISKPGQVPHGFDPPAGTIWRAVEENKIQEVERLLDSSRFGADDTLCSDIRPLTVAVWRGHIESAQLLLDRGAGIELVDNFGRNILHIAASVGDYRMLSLLLGRLDRRSEATNAQDRVGATPLHLAARTGNILIIRLLVNHDARLDIYARLDSKIALYDGGSAERWWDTARLLVSLGADPESFRLSTISDQKRNELLRIKQARSHEIYAWTNRLRDRFEVPADLLRLIEEMAGVYQQRLKAVQEGSPYGT